GAGAQHRRRADVVWHLRTSSPRTFRRVVRWSAACGPAPEISTSARRPLALFLLPQDPAEHFAHQRLRQLLPELDFFRHLVAGQILPAVLDELLRGGPRAFFQD